MKTMSLLRKTATVLTASAMLMSLAACGETETVVSQIPDSERYTAMANLPVFVNSKDECVDPEKEYVLPDGSLWKIQKVQSLSSACVNQIETSVNEAGETVGLLENQRYSSVDVLKECKGAASTGFIAVKAGDVVRMSGIQFRGETIGEVAPGAIYMRFYDANFALLGNCDVSALTVAENLSTIATDIAYDEEGDLAAFTLKEDAACAYMRMAFVMEQGQTPIITVNQEFTYEEVDGWNTTEMYVDASWHAEVMQTVADVQAIQQNSSGNTLQFLFNSDIHLEPTHSNVDKVKDIGKVSAGVMQACNIAFFVNGGDSTTQSSTYTIADMDQNLKDVLTLLEPIPQSNVLMTVGNHDGATGSKEVDGETIYYCYQLNNEQRAEVYFGWQQEDSDRRFTHDGTYYYIDDPETNTRFIMLNSFWEEFVGEEDGYVLGRQSSYFHQPIFGQAQLDWLVDVALKVPENYSVVIGTHNASTPLDHELFAGIVDAYVNKTTYTGHYTGSCDWQSSSVSADFSQETGEMIAIFQGHSHKDDIDTTTFAVPCITITTAGADVRDENKEDRVDGTSSATAIDVVTIDKEKRTIHLTRLGVGEDREVTY